MSNFHATALAIEHEAPTLPQGNKLPFWAAIAGLTLVVMTGVAQLNPIEVDEPPASIKSQLREEIVGPDAGQASSDKANLDEVGVLVDEDLMAKMSETDTSAISETSSETLEVGTNRNEVSRVFEGETLPKTGPATVRATSLFGLLVLAAGAALSSLRRFLDLRQADQI